MTMDVSKQKKKSKKRSVPAPDDATEPIETMNGSHATDGNVVADKKKRKRDKRVSAETTTAEPAEVEDQPKKSKKQKKKRSAEEPVEEVKEEPQETKRKSKKSKKDKALKALSEEIGAMIQEETKEATEPKKEKKKKSKKSKKPVDDVEAVPKQEAKAVSAKSTKSAAEIKKIRDELTITVTPNSKGDVAPATCFEESGLPADLVEYCTKQFAKPTPIQAQCWPIMVNGSDMVGIAETGSGKTLAFALPGIVHIRKQLEQKPLKKSESGPIMLVLSPTRELAMQSAVVCDSVGAATGLRSTSIYGGVDRHAQKQALRAGVHIMVATPGRLISLCREGICSLARTTYLVLDEADRMLDMGFEPAIRELVGQVSKVRQTLLFSATWPKEIQALASEFVKDPFHVTIGKVDELSANRRVTQTVEVIDEWKRDARLLELLKKFHSSGKNRILIFVLYKKEVPRIERLLWNKGYSAKGMSGDKGQHERTTTLEEFKAGTTPLLIATDVAARGLDVKEVTHVINYSFPLTVEDYVHRIGRTGRGGASGTSYTFFTRNDKHLAGELANVLRDAEQEVPEELLKFGAYTKKKAPPQKPMGPPKKVTF